MKCAIVIPVGPGHELLAEDAKDSVLAAFDSAPGPFSAFSTICVDDTVGALGRSAARNEGVSRAQQEGAEWVFFLDADDVMHPAAFSAFGPYSASFDAVWGAICELSRDEERGECREGQVLEINNIAQILSYDPWLTLQIGHFVKTEIAVSLPFDEAMDCGEDFDYYLRVWSRHKCIKVPLPLFMNRRGARSRGPRSATDRQWREAVEAVIARNCAALEFYSEFELDGELFRFYIANPFDIIQRHHLKRRFFEAEELGYVRERVKDRATILEVGANVGNHAVYYSRFLRPAKIILIEPNPAAIELLRKNLAVNNVSCADHTLIGMAAGRVETRYEVVSRGANNLGAAALRASPQGDIIGLPVDRMVTERIDFIKIDVEGMELEVLEGCRAVVHSYRPQLMIEIFRRNLDSFRTWVDGNGYRVTRSFEYVNAVNYFLESR